MASTMARNDAAFQGANGTGNMGLEALNIVNDAQKILKKSVNVILPAMLVLGGVGMIIYRFIAYDNARADVVKPFLVMVVVQLLPMAALKIKTWICSDLVSLMPIALAKTLMMHIAVLTFRMVFHLYAYQIQSSWAVVWWQRSFDCISLFVALIILFKVFDFKLASLANKEHIDVLTTIAGGCIVATIVNIIAPVDGRSIQLIWILNDFANYGEVLAFVPVVRIVCLEIGVEQSPGTNINEDDRRKAKMFMVFILAFYFWDDLCFAAAMAEIPLVAAGKAAHFVMLMDFAGYFVLQIRAQPKIVDEILPKVLPEAILQEVMPKQDPEMGFQTEEGKGLLGEEDDDFDM